VITRSRISTLIAIFAVIAAVFVADSAIAHAASGAVITSSRTVRLAPSVGQSASTSLAAGLVPVPYTRDPGTPPPCNQGNDGGTWTNPVSGIKYTCRFVSGAGWQWVPFLGCGAVPSQPYARESLPSC
jgi:hypothetical protein